MLRERLLNPHLNRDWKMMVLKMKAKTFLMIALFWSFTAVAIGYKLYSWIA